MRPFGDRLRDARKAAQLQQRDLGERLGVSNSAISAWETGRDVPSFALLPKLRAALGASLDDLICGDRESANVAAAVMRVMDDPAVAYQVAAPGRPPDDIEEKLYQRIREISTRKKRALLELLKPER